MHIVELQAQQKIEEEKTKQIDMMLQIKKMEFENGIIESKEIMYICVYNFIY